MSLFAGLLISCAPHPISAAPPAFILQDSSLPDHDTRLTQTLAASLKNAGYAPQYVTLDKLLQAGALTPQQCGLLVLPQARQLPGVLGDPMSHYLNTGGHLLALGAPLWQRLLVKDVRGQWTTKTDIYKKRALAAPAHLLYDFGNTPGVLSWERAANDMTSPTTTARDVVTANGRTVTALHVSISNLTGWDTVGSPVAPSAFPEGDTVTVFSAKGDASTRSLSIEWDEKNGDRWYATVPLTDDWQGYAVPAAAFRPWQVPAERVAAGFQPSQAVQFHVGLAFTFTGWVGGKHDYWFANIGTAPATAYPQEVMDENQLPALDALAPGYKFFPITTPVTLQTSPGQSITNAASLPRTASTLMSPQPRPGGAGFDKQRGWRQVSLITATDRQTGQWRGTPGTLYVAAPGAKNSGGLWASFTVTDPKFYETEAMQDILTQTARRMRDGLFLIEGGAQYYTVFPNQRIRLGAQVSNLTTDSQAQPKAVVVRIRVTAPDGHAAWTKTWPITVEHSESTIQSAEWTPPARWSSGGYTVVTELLAHGKVVDRLQHALAVWTPPLHPEFMSKTPDGHFVLHGRPWKALGVNYMPSSGIGVNDPGVFEFWLSRQSYDPEVIERDLSHIQALGMNCVSAFIYTNNVADQNLLDFLRHARLHHLLVNLSLRPELTRYRDQSDAAGLSQLEQNQGYIINTYHLAQNDTVFAYDVDWEPAFGNQIGRARLNGGWTAWVQSKYGSVEKAGVAWAFPPATDVSGILTAPTDTQVASPDGPATKMVLDYRHYLNGWLTQTYGADRAYIRTLDPHHFVSFRMSETGNPTYPDSFAMAYQFQGLANAVDFLSPEGYGRIGDWEKVKPGIFELAYARAVAPALPVLWAECGRSVADSQERTPTSRGLLDQGQFYHDFLRMSRLGGADGVIFWWYPGGYRFDEGSDYGLINPDGTDRPATKAVRVDGAQFLKAPPPPAPDTWLTFDSDVHPDGVFGIYQALQGPFFEALASGHHPGLRSVQSMAQK